MKSFQTIVFYCMGEEHKVEKAEEMTRGDFRGKLFRVRGKGDEE